MAKAKKSSIPSALSAKRIARIKELGQAGRGWRPWRLAKRYGVSEDVIIKILGKSAEARRDKPAAKPVANKAAKKSPAKKSKSVQRREKVQKAAKKKPSTLAEIFPDKKAEPEINLSPVPVADADASA